MRLLVYLGKPEKREQLIVTRNQALWILFKQPRHIGRFTLLRSIDCRRRHPLVHDFVRDLYKLLRPKSDDNLIILCNVNLKLLKIQKQIDTKYLCQDDCRCLARCLPFLCEEELLKEISSISSWPYRISELGLWADVLNIFDGILENVILQMQNDLAIQNI